MDGSLRIITELTLSEYLLLLRYKDGYLNLTNGERISRCFEIEKEAIEKLKFLRPYQLKEMERIEINTK
jgi:hypothetical protein